MHDPLNQPERKKISFQQNNDIFAIDHSVQFYEDQFSKGFEEKNLSVSSTYWSGQV